MMRSSIATLSLMAVVIALCACEVKSTAKPEPPVVELTPVDLAGKWEMRNVLVPDSADKGGFSIKITAGSGSNSDSREQIYGVETGIRDGRLIGCQIIESGKTLEDARCALEKGRFVIEFGKSEARLVFEMSKAKDGGIAGESSMRSSVLPLGKVKIGDVSLKRVAAS